MPDSLHDTPALDDLRRRLRHAADLLESVDVTGGLLIDERDSLLATINGYLLPRLCHSGVPLVVAVAGPGGAGKSHLVNRLIGSEFTDEGPVRPVTTAPVLIAPDGAAGEAWSVVMRHLQLAAPGLETVGGDSAATQRTTFLDLPAAPGASGNLPDLADMSLVVTTPTRYADAAQWELITHLDDHGIDLHVVLNRAVAADDEIADELRRLLDSAGIEASVHCVTEDATSGVDALAAVVDEAGSTEEIATVPPRIERRAHTVARRIRAMAEALRRKRRDDDHLTEIADGHYAKAASDVRRLIENGHLDDPAGTPWAATADRLTGMITHRIGIAAADTTAAWTETPQGVLVVSSGADELWRHPPDAAARARTRLDTWPQTVENLVTEDAKGRRLRPAVREALAAAVTERALGGEGKLRRRLRRRLRSGLDAVAERGRTALADIAADLVGADRSRFLSRLGKASDADLVASLDTVAEELDESPERGAAPHDQSADPVEEATDSVAAEIENA